MLETKRFSKLRISNEVCKLDLCHCPKVGDAAKVYWSDGDGGWRLWSSTIVSTRGRLYAGARERGVLVRYSDGNGLPEL